LLIGPDGVAPTWIVGVSSPPPVLEQKLWGLAEWVFYAPDVRYATQPSVSEH